MSSSPLVSIVIIFWNAQRFLPEALESVFVQTYQDWELLLVDDGSSDASTPIAQRIVAESPRRIRYLEHSGHQNRGMSASRNLGIQNARGKYIAFLDADDVWFSNTLTEQVAILEAHPQAGFVYGPIEYWYSWSGRVEDRARDYVEDLGISSNRLVFPPRLVALFLRDKAAVPSGLLVRREIVERVGGYEDDFRGEYEDQVICAKLCLEVPVFAAGTCWYRYRQHKDSSVYIGQSTGETFLARRRFLNWLLSYLDGHHIRDPQVHRAVELELWRYRHPRAFRLLRRTDHLSNRLHQFMRSVEDVHGNLFCRE